MSFIAMKYGMFCNQYKYKRYDLYGEDIKIISPYNLLRQDEFVYHLEKLLLEDEEIFKLMEDELINAYSHCCFLNMDELAIKVLFTITSYSKYDLLSYIAYFCICHNCCKGISLLLSTIPEAKEDIGNVLTIYDLVVDSLPILMLLVENNIQIPKITKYQDSIILLPHLETNALKFYLSRCLIDADVIKSILARNVGKDENKLLSKSYVEEQV